jgi:hypothetical protein
MTARRTELLHVVVTRATDRVRAGPTETRPTFSQLLDRRPNSVSVLRTQTVEPLLRLGCEHDLPRAPIRHPCRVMSLPVTEQDAFVPSLTNRCEARPHAPLATSPAPCKTQQITSRPPRLGHISIGWMLMWPKCSRGGEFAAFYMVDRERRRRFREPAARAPRRHRPQTRGTTNAAAGEPAARPPTPPANRFSFRRVPSTDRHRSGIRSRCRRPSQGPPSRRGCCPA